MASSLGAPQSGPLPGDDLPAIGPRGRAQNGSDHSSAVVEHHDRLEAVLIVEVESRLKQRYSGLGLSELRSSRQLEEKNTKLRKLGAGMPLDKAMLRAVLP